MNKLECKRCKTNGKPTTWIQRGEYPPIRCPRCGSFKWNIEPKPKGAATVTALIGLLIWAQAAYAQTGIATYYTTASCQAEGTSGVYTANGERYDESAMTCALPNRKFGTMYRVTNTANGKQIVCRQNDYGPGRKPRARGVVIDLTPAAYDALGGKRGCKPTFCYGEIASVTVEQL